ncbi:aromatase/cyclase [Gandjariella thermophila]|uniref:Actinorhodin polyketide synthase bifunctional cyclase/dehydratase n=1 Tax=Gandjariella thermophila TaxID=1931992 RepID=A0A4D4JCB2_9PSEU|nr:aromatase/cyclase [Gandjariella thermophila]GDY32009.1 actinorhodin polyketide synthase bifunctional cyclase/dehydratase [Gandjariella thermophila]
MQRNEVTGVRTEHSRTIAAPAATVYDLLADVRGWPVIFPPTIHAESTDLGGGDQRIRLWATANETVKTWTSLRRLDPRGLRIEFAQETPQDPVAAMRGVWTVRPLSADTCRVELGHEFSAVDDDPSALSWIERAVETNSAKELASLEAAATRAAGADKLVFEFSDSVEVRGPVRDAYEFIDRADAWAERLPHVAGVNLALVAPDVQLLEMDTVANDGSTHRTASYRVCFPDRAIVYKQTTFPPFLGGHVGCWSFTESDDASVVTSSHTVVLNPAELGRLPESARSVDAARHFVTRALSANSQATLRLMKDFVEGNAGS